MKRAFSIWHSAFRNIVATFLLYAIFLLLNASVVSAQTFRYPVADLGFCRDAKECFLYCQIEENKPACWSYGKFVLEEQVLGVTSDDEKHIEEEAKKIGISFPIAELGGCGSASECRSYCDNESNRNTCENFARSKKFGHYKEEGEMLEKAREKLGCNSFESCKNLCETPANRSKCESFGEEHTPPEFKQRKQEFMQKAQEVMGCGSFEACRSHCDNPVNRDSCQKFADEHLPQEMRQRHEELKKRIERGEKREGPGGCNSEESCRKYCEDRAHKDECQRGGNQGERRGGPGNDKSNSGERFDLSGYPQGRQDDRQNDGQDGKFGERGGQGEGRGCRNEAECRSICEQNPDKCPGFRRHQEQEQQNRRFEEQRNFQQQQNSNQQQYQNYQGPPENFQPPQQNQQALPQQNQQPPPQEQQQSQPQQTSSGSQPPSPPQ